MYSAATARTATVLDIPGLTTVSLVFFWIALTLWILVAVGLTHGALAGWRQRPSASQTATSPPVPPAQAAGEERRRASRALDRCSPSHNPSAAWCGSPPSGEKWTANNKHATRGEPRVGNDPGAGWRDRLVELHVLAQSGDDQAGVAAEHWLARDALARTLWHTVEQDCARLRGSESRNHSTGPERGVLPTRLAPEAAGAE
jgi:hypothetical protein